MCLVLYNFQHVAGAKFYFHGTNFTKKVKGFNKNCQNERFLENKSGPHQKEPLFWKRENNTELQQTSEVPALVN